MEATTSTPFTMTVGALPGMLKRLEVIPGQTVAEVLKKAEITVGEGLEIRLDDSVVGVNDKIPAGALQLVVTKEVKAN